MTFDFFRMLFPRVHPRLIAAPPVARQKSSEQTAKKEVQEVAFESLFSDTTSYRWAQNLKIEHDENWTRIRYDVANITPLFDFLNESPFYQVRFRDRTVASVCQLFFLDLVRSKDDGLVKVDKKKILVHRSEPHLLWNDQELKWHFEKDEPADQRAIFKAPLILEKLRKIAGDDPDRLRLMTFVMTQTSWNDMFSTTLAFINRQFNVTMMNGSGEGREDLIDSPRYRAYRINSSGDQCTITAIIAGNFTGCALADSLEIVDAFPFNEVGWYRCVSCFNLVTLTSEVELQFVAYPNNWGVKQNERAATSAHAPAQ